MEGAALEVPGRLEGQHGSGSDLKTADGSGCLGMPGSGSGSAITVGSGSGPGHCSQMLDVARSATRLKFTQSQLLAGPGGG